MGNILLIFKVLSYIPVALFFFSGGGKSVTPPNALSPPQAGKFWDFFWDGGRRKSKQIVIKKWLNYAVKFSDAPKHYGPPQAEIFGELFEGGGRRKSKKIVIKKLLNYAVKISDAPRKKKP